MKTTTKLLIALLLVTSIASQVRAADEFLIGISVQLENGQTEFKRQESKYTPDQDTLALDYSILTATNNATNVLSFSSVDTPYYGWFKNTETAALTGSEVFVTCTIKLRPEDVALLPLASTNITYYTTNGGGKFEACVFSE